IVVAFYVLIIAVLVGTTLRRRGALAFSSEEREEARHLLLYDAKTDKVRPSLAVPQSRINEAGLLTV
ncbi:UNVERIFIED_CONTAM: hypothetical protein GTU68_040265, partial [Idotea baltica]|nr:hypothetical protein [Idotea baltica]